MIARLGEELLEMDKNVNIERPSGLAIERVVDPRNRQAAIKTAHEVDIKRKKITKIN